MEQLCFMISEIILRICGQSVKTTVLPFLIRSALLWKLFPNRIVGIVKVCMQASLRIHRSGDKRVCSDF
jgi:hypothetical protein